MERQMKYDLSAKRIYVDLTLPIRILFIIMNLDLIKLNQSQIPFASGNNRQLGLVLNRIDDDPHDLLAMTKKKFKRNNTVR